MTGDNTAATSSNNFCASRISWLSNMKSASRTWDNKLPRSSAALPNSSSCNEPLHCSLHSSDSSCGTWQLQSVTVWFFPGAELWNACFHSCLPTYKEDHGPLAQQGPLRHPHFCESRCSHAQGFLAVRPSILRFSKGHRRQDVEHETTHKLHKAALDRKGMS